MKIGDILIRWYLKHKRDLPWRKTKDPYLIWISEIILQQTRIAQGTDYYLRFIQRFPDVQSLANADIDEVLKLWQGLGYYSRARNLHIAAQDIHILYKDVFPLTAGELIKLKGIGKYTSAAIASICFNEPIPVVDGNVIRWIGRMNGFMYIGNSDAMHKAVFEKAKEYMQKNNPGDFNQAMMEFGALQCVPLNPDCSICPFNKSCMAFRDGKISEIPLKTISKESKERFFNYLFITDERSFLIIKRTKKDIWQGLYEFPLVETSKAIKSDSIMESKKFKSFFINEKIRLNKTRSEFRHILSHQVIVASFYKIQVKSLKNVRYKNAEIVNLKNINQYPVSRLIEKFIQKELKK